MGRVRVITARRRRRPRRRRQARTLRRAVVLARRPEDRLSATPAAIRSRGPYFGDDAGIYVVPAAGGEPMLVREGGSEPEFDHTGTRIYLREIRNEKFTLLSVGVPTGDIAAARPRRDRARPQRRTPRSSRSSPDGKWIAFEERFRTYVAPFPRTGRPVDIGPATQAYPVQRVSRDAGFFLHWSGDSRRLYWALGPELFSRDLARDRSRFVEGGAARRPDRAGGQGHQHRLHGRRATSRPARSRWSARG